MKKLLAFLLALTLVFSFGSYAFADSSDGFEYVVEDGEATITHYTGTAENVVIPNTLGGAPVTVLAGYLFQNNETIKSVALNSNLKVIGEAAFSQCEKLESITIPAGVTEIGDYAFDGCYSLTAFQAAEENSSYKAVEGVLYSKDGKVLLLYPAGNTNTAFTVPSDVTIIGKGAFGGCPSLTEIIIPQGVTTIEDWAFYGLNITSVTLPDSLETLGEDAFECCYSLTTVTFGKGLKSIGDCAFCECENLTKVELPASLESLGIYVFGWCTSLTEIKVAQGNANYKDLDGVLYSKDGKTLVQYPPAKEGTFYNVPEGVTAIGDWAFDYCTALTEMKIPNSVTEIGMAAFQKCENLVSISLPKNLTEISDYLFCECNSLETIAIPAGVTAIGEDAFSYCKTLTSVILPKGVETIGKRAFYSCTAIPSIIVPGGVTAIGDEAFGYYYDEDRYGILPIEGFVLKGLADSAAQQYAINSRVAFETVSATDIPDVPQLPDEPETPTDVPETPTDLPYTLGDVNNDGKIDAKDALMVLKFAVNKIELTEAQKLAAEVDGKEGINAKDALEILKYAVKKIEKFPIEG